jgi:hypothetical protein
MTDLNVCNLELHFKLWHSKNPVKERIDYKRQDFRFFVRLRFLLCPQAFADQLTCFTFIAALISNIDQFYVFGYSFF